jgi:tetratricopeptide (TPR) repeat protein
VEATHGAKAHYRRGECFAGIGQYAEAVEAYEKGLVVEPTNKDIATARDTAQLALRHPENMSKIFGPKSDRNSLLHLRQVGEAVQHNLRVLRDQPFAKDVTYMTQRLRGTLRCIQYVLVDSAGKITSTNGSNSLQSAGVAEKLAEGKVIVCHMFVHVDTATHAQEYLCESGEDSNRFKGKPWNSFQQNILLITVKEASTVGVFNEFIPELLFK